MYGSLDTHFVRPVLRSCLCEISIPFGEVETGESSRLELATGQVDLEQNAIRTRFAEHTIHKRIH